LVNQGWVWYTTTMFDREFVRNSPGVIKDSLSKRGDDPKLLDSYLVHEKKWRDLVNALEPLRAQRNQISRGGKPTPAGLKKAKELEKKITAQETKLKQAEADFRLAQLSLPNLVDESVPVGPGESANTVIAKKGRVRLTSGRPHHELMTKLDWLDLKTAAEYSGSRFRYLKNSAAWAHLSMMNEAIRLATRHGFKPVIPPVLTRPETLEKAGFLPFAETDIFKVERDNLYLTGTSEQTLLALAANHVFDLKELPLRLVGFSTCFRREVGSYGKDVEGMFRTHQFDKVEMVVITTPEQSKAEHNNLVSLEEKFTASLDLPYQLVSIGSGDLGAHAAKKIDLEVWFPSQQRYRESHSASNCWEFQARRFGIKYRDQNGQEHFVHTLNGTLATERLLLSYVENHQRPDGSVDLPRRWRI